MSIDKAAHAVMEFRPEKKQIFFGRYEVFYHEERLYSVRDKETGIISLVYAREPQEAALAVSKTTQQEISARDYFRQLQRISEWRNNLEKQLHVSFRAFSEMDAGNIDAAIAEVEKWKAEHPEPPEEKK